MPALTYSVLRKRLRDYVGGRDRMLHALRLLRCVLVQGPWQPLLIRYHQARDRHDPLAVRDDALLHDLEAGEAVRRLRRDALARGFTVPGALVDEIATYARAVGLKRIDNPHHDCDAVHRIAHNPRIVEVARGYLETEPILLETKLYWTIPRPDERGRVNAPAEGGRFHYDLADLKALTVFVYLTDVFADCGPHVVISGSQARRTPLQILRRNLDDATAYRKYAPRIQVITGPRGTGWFEDITCYHKQAGAERNRLMLSIIYSLHRRPRAEVARPRPARATA
jgi:hypothetical protein